VRVWNTVPRCGYIDGARTRVDQGATSRTCKLEVFYLPGALYRTRVAHRAGELDDMSGRMRRELGEAILSSLASAVLAPGPGPDPTRRGPVPQYSSEYVPPRARAVLWPWRFPIVHLVGVRPEEYRKITPAALLMDISRGEENPLIHRCISVKIGGMNGSDF
jgi:hypothetical protein